MKQEQKCIYTSNEATGEYYFNSIFIKAKQGGDRVNKVNNIKLKPHWGFRVSTNVQVIGSPFHSCSQNFLLYI